MPCHFKTYSVTVNRQSAKRVNEGRKAFRTLGILWPVRSPDLTAPDFFLWGYLKESVYRNRPHTIHLLTRPIRHEVAIINQELLRRGFDSFVNRLRQCVAQEGDCLQDVICQE
jgi:hypothetical protein